MPTSNQHTWEGTSLIDDTCRHCGNPWIHPLHVEQRPSNEIAKRMDAANAFKSPATANLWLAQGIREIARLQRENAELRQDLSDARNGWESAVAERNAHEQEANDDGSEVDELYQLLVRRGWSQHDADEIAHMRSAPPPPADLSQMLNDLIEAAKHHAIHGAGREKLLEAKRQNILNYDWCLRAALRESTTQPPPEFPEELFNGHAVWLEVGNVQSRDVSAVLDAVVRLIRKRTTSTKSVAADECMAKVRQHFDEIERLEFAPPADRPGTLASQIDMAQRSMEQWPEHLRARLELMKPTEDAEPVDSITCPHCEWSGTVNNLNKVDGYCCPKCGEPLFPPEWLSPGKTASLNNEGASK